MCFGFWIKFITTAIKFNCFRIIAANYSHRFTAFFCCCCYRIPILCGQKLLSLSRSHLKLIPIFGWNDVVVFLWAFLRLSLPRIHVQRWRYKHLMGSNSNTVLNKWIEFYAIFFSLSLPFSLALHSDVNFSGDTLEKVNILCGLLIF